MAEEKTDFILNTNEEAHKLVTKENVTAALHKDKGSHCVLNSYEIIDFTSKGDNYACFVTSVKVDYTANGNKEATSYVVKLNPCRSGMAAMANFTSNAFTKESNFFIQLLPLLNDELVKIGQPPLRVPKCFYACSESGKEMIFLQDMRPLDFKMSDRKVGLDEQHTILVLDELARLHSASALLAQELGEENLENKYKWLEDMFINVDEESKKIFDQFFISFIETGAKIAEKLENYDSTAKHLRSIAPVGTKLLEKELVSENPLRVVCHGDCWNNNLLFRYNDTGNPVEVCMVDFQVNRVASQSLDLNYFFYSSLTGPVRQKLSGQFFDRYYASYKEVLSASGKVMPFSLQELKEDYKSHNGFGLLMSLMVVPIVVMETADTPDFQDISEENMDDKMKEDANRILSMVETSPLLRPRFLDMFDEMIASGVIPS